jgi:uncharacterized SAM-binding protein YcdF (DUF218 family)
MEPGEFKPLLAALMLPPAGPLLLALLGLLLAARRWLTGAIVTLLGIGLLWFLSCNAVGVELARSILPQAEPLNTKRLEINGVQAIVVLGGGVLEHAPEYGKSQPSGATLERLRYGAWLSRQTRKPIGFAGGVGWAAAGTSAPPEADVAHTMLHDDYKMELRWTDSRSRDTAEGARFMAEAMRADKIQRIALVTHAWHMPRSVAAFRKAGFEVTPAPIDFPQAHGRPLLEWLPSAEGLGLSRAVLREWAGIKLGAF